ncbi:hypothetical protein LguiB_000113 [Lonicera macranthoides]
MEHKSTHIKLKEKYAVIVKVSSDGTSSVLEPPSKSEDEIAALEDLHLEPKLQLKLEQKKKTKISIKIRPTRKKLVRPMATFKDEQEQEHMMIRPFVFGLIMLTNREGDERMNNSILI